MSDQSDSVEATPAGENSPADTPAGLKFENPVAVADAFAAAFNSADTVQDEKAPEASADDSGAEVDQDGPWVDERTAGEDDDDEAEPEEAEGSADLDDSDEAYERALLALRYAGVPGQVIKNASRDELIAWGTKAADRRAKQEAALEERAARIRELEERATKAPAKADKPAEVDWSPHLTALAETLGLEPDAATKAFRPVLDAVANQVRTELGERLSMNEKALQEQQAAEGRRQISEQVRRLSDSWPKLKTDGDLLEKLNGKALALWKTGSYQDAQSVYDDAAKLILGAPTAALAAKRRLGAAPPPTGRAERPQNFDDAFLSALDAVEAGDMRRAHKYGAQVQWTGPGRRAQKK